MFLPRPFRFGYGDGNLGPLQPEQQPKQPEQPEQPEQPYGWYARDDRDDRESGAEAREEFWDEAKGTGATAPRLVSERAYSQRPFTVPRDGRGRGRGRATQASRSVLKEPGNADDRRGEDGEDGEDSEDGEDDTEGEENMQEVAARVSTCGEAMEYCTLLLRRQVELAEQADAEANVAIRGDAFARRSAITLLTTQQMRQLFMRLVQDRHNWERLRPLFGSPPYHFLAPEDAGLLRAAGLGHGRVNMAYEQAGAANYNQFGIAHLVDQHGREYRAVGTGSASDSLSHMRAQQTADRVVPYALSTLREASRVQLFCRLKKKRRSHRGRLLRDPLRRAGLSFPSVNEELVLAYSPELVRVWPPAAEAMVAVSRSDRAYNSADTFPFDSDAGKTAEYKVRVNKVQSRGARAATAVVVATRL